MQIPHRTSVVQTATEHGPTDPSSYVRASRVASLWQKLHIASDVEDPKPLVMLPYYALPSIAMQSVRGL